MNRTFYREYFLVQNTGWSGGVSWFNSTDSEFSRFGNAMAYAKSYKKNANDPAMKHRVLKVEVTRTETEFEI